MSQTTLTQPARKQVAAPVRREQPVDKDSVNIWTGKRLRGAAPREPPERGPSKYRCDVARDAGRTRADAGETHYFCLHFARGCCAEGAACSYLHRLPADADEARLAADPMRDIFGRERYGPRQDGRRGAGSWTRDCRTLFVSYAGAASLALPQLRPLLVADFGEWGAVEDIHIKHEKTIAFVRYRLRASAEFAKEAMARQTLRGSGLPVRLQTRWANDDPAPRAQRRAAWEREEQLRSALSDAVNSLPPEAKRARLQQLGLAAGVRAGAAVGSYPDTDEQYSAPGSKSWQEGRPDWYAFHLQQQQVDQVQAHAGGGERDVASEAQGWEHVGASGAAQEGCAGYDAQAVAAAWSEYYRQCAEYYGEHAAASAASGQETRGDEGSGNALGLLAGYGSGSEDEARSAGGEAAGGDEGGGAGILRGVGSRDSGRDHEAQRIL